MADTDTITRRPATPAEIATTAHLPKHRQIVAVEDNEDGRAVVGRARTIHRATISTDLNAYDESLGRRVYVACGSTRYRNCAGKAQPTATSSRYEVDCAKCLAA